MLKKVFFLGTLLALAPSLWASPSSRCAAVIDQILSGLTSPRAIQGSFSSLRQLAEKPLEVGAKKKMLLGKIEYWSKVANRDIKISELHRIEMASFLYQSLRIDSPMRTVSEIKHLFFVVEESYFSLLSREKELLSLKSLKSELLSHKDGLVHLQNQTDFYKRHKIFSLSFLKKVSKAKNNEEALILIENEMILTGDHILKRGFDIHQHMAQYSTARNFLDKMLVHSDPKIANKSREILKNLNSEITIDGLAPYYRGIKIQTPRMKEIFEALDRHPLSELLSLKQQVRVERSSALIGRLPNQQLHELMDKIISKIPWANNPEMRSYLRTVIDEKNKLVFYPQIDRVVYSDGQLIDKLKLLREIDSYDNKGELLSIFARRSDVTEEWRKLYSYAQSRSEIMGRKLGDQAINDAEVIFFGKMKEAQNHLRTMGPLAPWHVPSQAHYFRVVVDGVFLSTGSYALYKVGGLAWHKVFPNGPEAQSKADPQLIGSKAPTPAPIGTTMATSSNNRDAGEEAAGPPAPSSVPSTLADPPKLEEVLNSTEVALDGGTEASAPESTNPFEF